MIKRKVFSMILVVTLLVPIFTSIAAAAEESSSYIEAKEYLLNIGYDQESMELLDQLGIGIVNKAQRLQQIAETKNYLIEHSGVEIEEVEMANMSLTDGVIPDSKMTLYIFADTGWDIKTGYVTECFVDVAYNWITRPLNLFTDAMTFTCGDKFRISRFVESADMMLYNGSMAVNNYQTSPGKAAPRSVGWYPKLTATLIGAPTGSNYSGYASIEIVPVSSTSKSISETLTAEYVHVFLPAGISLQINGSLISIDVSGLYDSKGIVKNFNTGTKP